MTACFFRDGWSIFAAQCSGPLDRHHVIRKNRLKQEFPFGAWRMQDGSIRPAQRIDSFKLGVGPRDLEEPIPLDEILADERNLITLCRKHHDLVEGKRIYIPRSAMQSVEEFARDYGLEGWLDKYAPKEAA